MNKRKFEDAHNIQNTLSELQYKFQLPIGIDSQFDELIKGVSILHTKMKSSIDQSLNETINNLEYNLPIENHEYAYGLIQFTSTNHKIITIKKNTTLSSIDCIYKTTHDIQVSPVQIEQISIFNTHDNLMLNIKLKNLGKTPIERITLFTNNDIINNIFQNQNKIHIQGTFNETITLTYYNEENIFANMNHNFLSFFTVSGINNPFGDIILNIPINTSFRIYADIIKVNCGIIVNKFTTYMNIHDEMLEYSPSYNIIKINNVYNHDGKVPSIKEDKQGWSVKMYKDNLFIRSNIKSLYAEVTCENKILNTQNCKFQESIPVNCQWKIKPQKVFHKANSLDVMKYITSSPKYIAESLLDMYKIAYNITQEDAIIEQKYQNVITYQKGYKLFVEIHEINFIIMNKIKKEINRYHLCQLTVINSKNQEFEI